MSEAFKESTVVTIAHRTNTIINSDLVIILDQGTVLE
jgi:ABC-type multidrug transport system fused ATPase/permease subunit